MYGWLDWKSISIPISVPYWCCYKFLWSPSPYYTLGIVPFSLTVDSSCNSASRNACFKIFPIGDLGKSLMNLMYLGILNSAICNMKMNQLYVDQWLFLLLHYKYLFFRIEWWKVLHNLTLRDGQTEWWTDWVTGGQIDGQIEWWTDWVVDGLSDGQTYQWKTQQYTEWIIHLERWETGIVLDSTAVTMCTTCFKIPRLSILLTKFIYVHTYIYQ
jgi:hypothetical protein